MGARGPKPGTVSRPPGAGRKKGSRNKATREIKELALPYSAEAVDTLVKIMRKSKSDQSKVAACREILDRAYGKAAQPLTTPAGNGGLIIEIMRFANTIEHHPIQEVLPAPSGDP